MCSSDLEGYTLLRRMTASAGPFLSPNERWQDGRVQPCVLPWFTTAAGAAVAALHSSLVQVDAAGSILFRGVTANYGSGRFAGLAASHGVTVSGEVHAGTVIRLVVKAPTALRWTFALPQDLANAHGVIGQNGTDGLCRCERDLVAGDNVIIGTKKT